MRTLISTSVHTHTDAPARQVPLRGEAVLALLLRRQHLSAASAGEQVLPVIGDLLGLHATVPASPYLQLHARMQAFVPARLDALLDTGGAAKLACMRRTLFVESAELAPLVLAATRELALRDHARFLAANGLTRARYEQLAERVERVLQGRALDAIELRAAVGADVSLSPVLIVMCDQARLLRWRGRSGWQGGRPRYRRFEEALPTVRYEAWEERAAVRELVDRYVRRYGPVNEDDIAWWTGLRKTTVRAAVASLPNLVHATVEDSAQALLIDEGDVGEAQRRDAAAAGEVSLLPVLDPYLQGYRDRTHAVAAPHLPHVVDRGGNTTSVVLVGGRVAGVWDAIKSPAPELRVLFFERVDATTRRRVHTLAAELSEVLLSTPARVRECDEMQPLAQQGMGGFLSPLKEAP